MSKWVKGGREQGPLGWWYPIDPKEKAQVEKETTEKLRKAVFLAVTMAEGSLAGWIIAEGGVKAFIVAALKQIVSELESQ